MVSMLAIGGHPVVEAVREQQPAPASE
jgi:hypothetical protein